MRVVMLISSFYPLIGGAETQAQRLGSKLVQQGHEIIVLTRWHKGLDKNELIDGICVKRLKVTSLPKLAPIIYMIKALFYIIKNYKKINILHAHALSAPGVTASIASFITNIPSIAKIAGGGNKLGCEIKRIYHSGALGKIKVLFMRKYISKFIAISKAIEKDLLDVKIPASKIYFLPNGINTENYKENNSDEKNVMLNKLSLPRDKKLFLYAGRLEKVKGIDILLDAWVNLEEEYKVNSTLIILGDGSINISSYLSDSSIIYKGKVNNVNEYLSVADFFVLPSRYEGISNALLEAMASKLTIIASDVGGNPDVIKNNINGLLFEAEKVDALSKVLQVLIAKDGYERFGEQAYNFILRNFDLDVISKNYLQLYKEISYDHKDV
ncbi:glycosyltransferase family 4 protein [Alkalihalobacillus sp. AL-G]|uniref:glycosyltransferase family 4 protein n=1 Tax=Alkalihalobacillus sp. AL-G TaxID=2926399 RepID=UPI00272D98F3|nr:glycosyltransferase family 4 protein [Alkalihalobacillus sp. AL-G]WLD93009.1 glycosyltransferase family 4 protein [Alkalihalobacillus sp. AL-G]